MISISKNGGETFSPPRPIVGFQGAGHPQVCLGVRTVLNGDIRVNEFPSVAIDTFGSPDRSSPKFNPHHGAVYVAYTGRGEAALDEADVYLVTLDP